MAGRSARPASTGRGFLHDKDVEIARLSGIYVTNLQKAGAHLLHGRAQIVDAHTVEVLPKSGSKDAGRYTARKILIATGGRPWKPDFPGAELGITSDEAFHLPSCPSG
jgi:glutathione reductase (NADPH)